MDNFIAAKQLISYLDLTSLSEKDTDYSIADLCHRAQTPYGNVAAVCVYSRFLQTARQELNNNIKIATSWQAVLYLPSFSAAIMIPLAAAIWRNALIISSLAIIKQMQIAVAI